MGRKGVCQIHMSIASVRDWLHQPMPAREVVSYFDDARRLCWTPAQHPRCQYNCLSPRCGADDAYRPMRESGLDRVHSSRHERMSRMVSRARFDY